MKRKKEEDFPPGTFLRECQECGHFQEAKDPGELSGPAFEKYRMHVCRRCKSEALDYGSVRIGVGRDPDDVDPEQD